MSLNLSDLENFNEILGTKKEEILDENLQQIEEEVRRLGCTYPSELARNTLIPKERVVSLIWKLIKQGVIWRLKLDKDRVPIEMVSRIHDFWGFGIHGYEMFSRITWVIPQQQIPYSKYYKMSEGAGVVVETIE